MKVTRLPLALRHNSSPRLTLSSSTTSTFLPHPGSKTHQAQSISPHSDIVQSYRITHQSLIRITNKLTARPSQEEIKNPSSKPLHKNERYTKVNYRLVTKVKNMRNCMYHHMHQHTCRMSKGSEVLHAQWTKTQRIQCKVYSTRAYSMISFTLELCSPFNSH